MRGDQPERRNRLALALQRQRLDGLHNNSVARERERLEADEHLARSRRLLQACGDVDRVAGREPLGGTGDDLAGRDADPIPRSGRASRISTAARQARRASSSCNTGTPKTAITASPMNFSTVPP